MTAVGAIIDVRVELFGVARLTAGRRELTVSLPRRPAVPEVVAALARACPDLVGKVIAEDRTRLMQSQILNLNGMAFVGDGALKLAHDDHLLLFSSQAGG
jgi:molybdopterin converting factor small subunit